MKILKKTGLVLLGLVVLFTIVGLFLPSKAHVERSLVINAKPEPIFNQINNLKNWENWSPWHKKDPNMKLTYEGPEAGTGAKYIWLSDHDEVGNGELFISKSTPFSSIQTQMNFMESGMAMSEYILQETQNGTKITWTIDSDFGYDIPSRYFGLLLETFLAKDFEEGLQSLKNVVENQPKGEATTAQAI